MVVFVPDITDIGEITTDFTEEDIEREPMIYGGSVEWVRQQKHAPITNEILSHITRERDGYLWTFRDEMAAHAAIGYHPVIDTKSVLLMPGQYPCIPGWHCDGVVRQSKTAQPDLDTLHDLVYHYVATITAGGAHVPTELITTRIEMPDTPRENVWATVSEFVERPTTAKATTKSRPGCIVRFSRSTLHRGLPATERCWRYFFRLSFYHMPVMNRIRNQVQVYTDTERGW